MAIAALQVADELAQRIRAEYAEYLSLSRRTLDLSVRLGSHLVAAKEAIGHGGWLEWLATIGVHERTARRLMAVYEERDRLEDLPHDTPVSAALQVIAGRRRAEPPDERDRPRLSVVSTQPAPIARFYVGDLRDRLAELGEGWAQTCITSPPFWGLRDYKLSPSVWGGDGDHPHEWTDAPWKWDPGGRGPGALKSSTINGSATQAKRRTNGNRMGAFCGCGAWRGQLGLEPWPELYVEHIVEAFRAVWRALRNDGVLWLEIGDSYAGSGKGPTGWSGLGNQEERQGFEGSLTPKQRGTNYGGGGREFFTGEGSKRAAARAEGSVFTNTSQAMPSAGLKPKDLIGIPWMVAFALRADGWYLRQDNVWGRPNPMPESVKDRSTRAHSYVFQLTKRRKYFYDPEAIAEPASGTSHPRGGGMNPKAAADEWAQEEREHGRSHRSPASRSSLMASQCNDLVDTRNKRSVWMIPTRAFKGAHFATFPEGLPVDPIKSSSREGDWTLDPFAGAGTVGVVSARLGRNHVGIDANPDYVRNIAAPRLRNDAPLLIDVEVHT